MRTCWLVKRILLLGVSWFRWLISYWITDQYGGLRYLDAAISILIARLVNCFKIQGDSGGKVNILGGDSTGPCEKKGFIWRCLILKGYRGRVIWTSVRFLFVGSDEGRTLQIKRLIHKTNCLLAVLDAAAHMKKREYQLRLTTLSLRASCKVRRVGRLDFRTFIVNCNKFVTSV